MGDGGYRQMGAKTFKEKKDIIQWESRTADSESEWVMKGTDKFRQRERGCYSVGEQKSRQ